MWLSLKVLYYAYYNWVYDLPFFTDLWLVRKVLKNAVAYILLDCENTVPDNVHLVNVEDGSVTWLTTAMLAAEDSISADQLGLNCIDVQVLR